MRAIRFDWRTRGYRTHAMDSRQTNRNRRMIIKTLLEPLALVGKYPTEPIVSLLGPHVLLDRALSQTSDDTTFTKSSGHTQQHIPLFHSSKEKAHQTVHDLHIDHSIHDQSKHRIGSTGSKRWIQKWPRADWISWTMLTDLRSHTNASKNESHLWFAFEKTMATGVLVYQTKMRSKERERHPPPLSDKTLDILFVCLWP